MATQNRNLSDYLQLVLKGIGMGAADVIPGVSGGTIAFIVGIYEELINSIKSVNLKTLKLFFTLKWAEFFKAINAPFLCAVMLGILISVFSLARIITYLLATYPIYVWSFFFGLILISTYFVAKKIEQWSWSRWLSFIVGAAMAFYITVATPAHTPTTLPFIFLCGAVAICAMILPGISGSFILLLLGKYEYIMDAIKHFDIKIILLFGSGAAIGLVLFSNVLSFLLKRYHDITIALLAGFMLGSLNKVWPWKEIFEQEGVELTRNIAPNEHLLPAILLMVGGCVLVYAIEHFSGSKEAK